MATPTISSGATPTSATATASCTTAVPDHYGHVPVDACNANYNFYPSFDGNLAFTVLFGLSTVVHLAEAIIFKKRFCWVIIMGGCWETAAFVLRTLGAHDQQKQIYAIAGQILFLLAPLWVNAFAYMTVARMIHLGLPERKMWGIRASKLTLLFIWMDVACFIVQLGGGSLMSNNGDGNLIRIGQKVYMAGIALQMVFIIVFGTMTVFFWKKMHQVTGGRIGPMRFLIWAMLAVLVLVTIRIIYRLVEFGAGVSSNNPMLSNEAYPFGLDATPMVLALAILNVMHPGHVLRGPDSEFPRLSRQEKKAIKAQKKEEKQAIKMQKTADKVMRRSAKNGGKDVYETPEGDYLHPGRPADGVYSMGTAV